MFSYLRSLSIGLLVFWLLLSGYWDNGLLLLLGVLSMLLVVYLAGRIERYYPLRSLANPRTLLRLPESIAQLDVDRQAKLIEARFDLADFQDPDKVEKLMTRFTTLWEVENPSTPAQSLVASLFQPVEFGISQDTLMAIASMKR